MHAVFRYFRNSDVPRLQCKPGSRGLCKIYCRGQKLYLLCFLSVEFSHLTDHLVLRGSTQLNGKATYMIHPVA